MLFILFYLYFIFKIVLFILIFYFITKSMHDGTQLF